MYCMNHKMSNIADDQEEKVRHREIERDGERKGEKNKSTLVSQKTMETILTHLFIQKYTYTLI